MNGVQSSICPALKKGLKKEKKSSQLEIEKIIALHLHLHLHYITV